MPENEDLTIELTSEPENPLDQHKHTGTDASKVTLEDLNLLGTWDDIRTSVNMVRVPGTKAPTWTAYKGGQVLAFSDQAVAGNEEEVYFSILVPHDWKKGSNIIPHVHWTPKANEANKVVRWGLNYSWFNLGDIIPATTTIYTNSSTNNDLDRHKLENFAELDGTVKDIGSIIICKLFRNSSHGDDSYGDDAYFLEIDFHYRKSSIGSKTELLK